MTHSATPSAPLACWPCGTPKSTGNAFDWRRSGSLALATDVTFRETVTKGNALNAANAAGFKANGGSLPGLSHKGDNQIAAFAARDAIEQARHGGAYSKAVPARKGTRA